MSVMSVSGKLSRLTSHGYSACDVSDALLKLKVAGAGFVPAPSLVPAFGRSGYQPPYSMTSGSRSASPSPSSGFGRAGGAASI